MSRAICRSCDAPLKALLDLGSQPPSNRFKSVGSPDPDLHPLILGQCPDCGFLQLINPMPPSMVRSRYPWLIYREPEEHLDVLVRRLAVSLSKDSLIIGFTAQDDPMLDRFKKLGYKKAFCCDRKADLGISDPCAGLETIQETFNDAAADRLTAKHGKADLLIARYALEHAHAPVSFLKTLNRVLAPSGRLVLEVPDCRKFIAAGDYSFIWEEHISYFSPQTAAELIRRNHLGKAGISVYARTLEDSLVIIIQPDGDPAGPAARPFQDLEFKTIQQFAAGFDPARSAFRNHLSLLQKRGKRTALFGAGHLAVKFLNFFDLKGLVDYVIDDDPHKQGLAMPGSGIPIVNAAYLREIDLCLLSLNPENEKKVIAKQQVNAKKGCCFASIFKRSPLALKVI
ncbi:MAG TPA: class I SAM-dependent methyltransferase [Candidatus Omnitrophota bacterium]|nr:class I SAM-dependent methyltransferase [Candidatus Omnitrophota bacterium]HRY85183.1 class I SAM-dependent methyltransferase [Candidatus Omnitrophota bacterium]